MKAIHLKSLFLYLSLALISFFRFPLEAEQKLGPDFIVIGAQKGGTTALRAYLNHHPFLLLPKKEVHFFDMNFHLGKQWYEKQLPKRPNAQYLIGEKSPSYLIHPTVPERVYSLYPQVKLIVILRNPVDRAYSHYWHNIGPKRENLSFEKAIEAEFSRIQGEKEKLIKNPLHDFNQYRHYSYLTRGIYVDQLKNWFKFFPREQMLILSSDDLYKFPKITMKKICAFLGVPNHAPKKNLSVHKGSYPPMSLEMRQHLTAYFHPYNEELEKLLNRKFNWNKDDNK
jgi:hypothetical protein